MPRKMHRTSPVFAAVLAFALSVVSTVFVLLALTSKSWTRQNYYNAYVNAANVTNIEIYNSLICYATRSPFYRCGLPEPAANASDSTVTCQLSCQSYMPDGNNTSCLTLADDPSGTTSDTFTECQAVHYAGNLQIAASFFVTFGLLLIFVLSLYTVAISVFARRRRRGVEETVEVIETDAVVADNDGTAEVETKRERERHRHSRAEPSARSPATPYITAVMLFSLYAGAALQVLAQYFGVLGLSTYANPTPHDAIQDNQNLVASQWVIDKGLNTYATTAWTSAIAAAMVAGTVFRVPSFPKIL